MSVLETKYEVVLTCRSACNDRLASRVEGTGEGQIGQLRVVRKSYVVDSSEDFYEPQFYVEQRRDNDRLGNECWLPADDVCSRYMLLQYLCHLEDGGVAMRKGVERDLEVERSSKERLSGRTRGVESLGDVK